MSIQIAAFFAALRLSTHEPASADALAYREALAAVETGLVEINTDPSAAVAKLRAALAELRDHAPRLAADPEALELRTLAELALARALLSAGDHEAAAAAVDRTLAGLGPQLDELALPRLGPSLTTLVEERRAALEARGRARLRVACSVACTVYVDERLRVDAAEAGVDLPLGEHRVWIEGHGEREGAAPLRTTLTLAEAGRALTLAYPEPSAPAPGLVGVPAGDPVRDRPSPIRAAPRWAEVTTLALGGAALAAGAVLLALDSRCPGGVDPRDADACPQLYDTRNAGIGLLSAGAAATLTGGVMLIVDETRIGDRRGRELALVWTARF